MTLDDCMEGFEVTAQQAMREVARHGCMWDDFTAEHGVKEVYMSNEVLEWLGY